MCLPLYRRVSIKAGLFEVIKCGIIRNRSLFDLLDHQRDEMLALQPAVTDQLIAAAVKIKAEVVTADEREGDLRRILNFGHTIGHAMEAETAYIRLLHGEAVAWGMLAATRLAELTGTLKGRGCRPDCAGDFELRAASRDWRFASRQAAGAAFER
jgi:3-dehydroquinate synthase